MKTIRKTDALLHDEPPKRQPGDEEDSLSGKPRVTRSNGRATRLAVRDAAVDLFYTHGYKNVSLRTLAGEVGLQAGSLYNHISTKQDLLYVLLRDIMIEILEATKDSVEKSEGVIEELAAFIKCHLEFHTSRLKEVYIGNSELRNLDPENRRNIVAIRKEYFDIILDIVNRGIQQRLFVSVNSQVGARVIMGMLNGVSGWYRATGETSVAELTYIYTTMAFRALGAPVAAIQSVSESLAASTATDLVPSQAAKRSKSKARPT